MRFLIIGAKHKLEKPLPIEDDEPIRTFLYAQTGELDVRYIAPPISQKAVIPVTTCAISKGVWGPSRNGLGCCKIERIFSFTPIR